MMHRECRLIQRPTPRMALGMLSAPHLVPAPKFKHLN